jgi:hypothetical protein
MPRALAKAFMVMPRVFNSASSARASLSVSVPPGPLPYEGLHFGCVGPREPLTTTMVLGSYVGTAYFPGGLHFSRRPGCGPQGVTQVPPRHSWPMGQALPQRPQLLLLVAVK